MSDHLEDGVHWEILEVDLDPDRVVVVAVLVPHFRHQAAVALNHRLLHLHSQDSAAGISSVG